MTATNLNIDQLDVQKLKEGDIASFDKLFHKYADRLYQFSMKYLKSVEEAEEIVQSVFLYIWENREGLKPEQSFNAYLFTIANNKVKKYFLKKARENQYKDEVITTFLEQQDNLDNKIDYKMLLKKVETIVNSMPAKRKEVFIMRKFNHLPIKEIAAKLDVSPKTIENHLTAAQKQILTELEKDNLTGLLFFALFC
ncbi:RNA polymerase sigma-70 factor [Prolixibacteraceae bacterium JC049]|nr:RNA polymerase sigma-70 factor [Prolixibacteraceae bacterium JC049]